MRFLYLLLLISLFACKKEDITNPSVSSSTNFDGRVTYFWDRIEPYPKSANDSIIFYHIADVSSPIVNGEVTSATGMEIIDHYCYVTYHIAGATYGGAIEVFDITTPSNPELVSQLIMNDTDFNECTISNGKLYAVGGRDIYSSDFTANDTKGGILLEIGLTNNLLSTNYRWAALPSYSGNSVTVAGDYLFVVSGSTGGGVFTLNKSDLALVQSDFIDNAKFCDIKNSQIGEKMIVLQGYPSAKLHEYTAGPNNVSNKIEHDILSQVVPYNGKAVLHIDNNDVYVCTGVNGLMGFHLNNLSTPFLNFNSPLEANSNGVDTDNEFIYIANGQEGLIIVNKDDQTIHTIFSYEGSANYVQSNGQYVFIANGKGGLKIIRRVDPVYEIPTCEDRPELTPNTINGVFVANMAQILTYRGSNTINKDFTNYGEFYYCGNLNLKRKVILNNGSITEVEGVLRAKDLFLNPGATLRIKGQLIVDGSFHLKGNLEFIGDGNIVNIGWNVFRGPDYTVTGGTYFSNVPL